MNDQTPFDARAVATTHTADATTVEEGLAIQERRRPSTAKRQPPWRCRTPC
jgi:hypothetical protein